MKHSIKLMGVILSLIIVYFCAVFTFSGCSLFDKYYYEFTHISGGYSISCKSGYEFSGNIKLPNKYEGEPVIEIAENGFSNCYKITKLTIPDNVVKIKKCAFSGCENLISVTIGKGVKSIENQAFFDCLKLVEVNNLSSVIIQKGEPENGGIGEYALNIYNATLGSSKLITKSKFVFYTDENLVYLVGYKGDKKHLTLPKDFNGNSYDIYTYAFIECNSLESVVIPDNNISSIGMGAFRGCNNLKSVVIGNGVFSIGICAFAGSGLTSALFKNASGWSIDLLNGERKAVSEKNLTDPITAAKYLRDNLYGLCQWKQF